MSHTPPSEHEHSDKPVPDNPNGHSEQPPTGNAGSNFFKRVIILAVVVGAAIFLSRFDLRGLLSVFLVLVGFGAVIFVHELGHFVAAKSVGILVEVFSLGMGPVLVGVRRTEEGFRVRLLPELLPGKNGEGALGFLIPTGQAKAGETEYRLSLVPLGGYVKMLGQDDTGLDQLPDNPRAFNNRPIWARLIVVSAGVFMNLVAGAAIFTFVFTRGVELPPAVAGTVDPCSPAAVAGVQPGDRILAIEGKKQMTFMDVMISSAFSDPCESLSVKVEHLNGEQETFSIVPRMDKQMGLMKLGIGPGQTLTIAPISENEAMDRLGQTGLQAGDTIVAVNGEPVETVAELEQWFYPAPGEQPGGRDALTLTVERPGSAPERAGQPAGTRQVNVTIPWELDPAGPAAGTVLGMVPRLTLPSIVEGSPAEQAGLQAGDIVVQIGEIKNPTMQAMQDYIGSRGGDTIQLRILRKKIADESEQKHATVDAAGDTGGSASPDDSAEYVEKVIELQPKKPTLSFIQRLLADEEELKNRKATIGVFLGHEDYDHPIVATIRGADTRNTGNTGNAEDAETTRQLSIPDGARITHVGDVAVENWYEIIDAIKRHEGGDVTLGWESAETSGSATTSVPTGTGQWLGYAYRPDLNGLAGLPLDTLKEVFRGESLAENLRLGFRETYNFIAQSYLMIGGVFKGTVGVKAASGPVGIMKISYTVAHESNISFYLYFFALISVCIAVFNFLPLPVLDGGLAVLLLVEKLKGSPLSLRTQNIITTTGLVMLLALVAVVTYNDILKIFRGEM